MKLTARTLRGLEWVAAAEIERRLPDATSIRMAPREVTFEYPILDAALLQLQPVDDIFCVVSTIDGVGSTKDAVADLASRMQRLDWEPVLAELRSVRTIPDGFFFDVVASIDGAHRYNRFDVENAAGAALAPQLGGTHLARTAEGFASADRPDLTVRVFVQDGSAVVAVRLTAAPLHRRPYKQATGPGTLHPPAAAALATIAGVTSDDRVYDPFCGDGTIAIETALQHPGIVFGASDLDPVRVDNARQNAGRAGVDVDFRVADAALISWQEVEPSVVLTNPPWNNAVHAAGGAAASLDAVWRAARPALRGGRLCVLADEKLGIPERLAGLGYRPSFTTLIRLNGRLTSLVVAGAGDGPGPELAPELRAWHTAAHSGDGKVGFLA
ncbi:methyltransferase [Microbacterium sp. W4I20]|uniref:methyltransferase n=1 Tax=Microbacterium sp. W4I20 TaxID=3042262 RepID=UPI0027834E7F|nr:methyltransferase [Microbacterium sp. W4I20]MDQ0727961.1 tRNA (guanine6-N2)-methyltransferase [Microbacterium sp. W4I20]